MTLPHRFPIRPARLTTTSALLLLASLALPAPARSAENSVAPGRESVRVVVNHADLDLRQRAGVERLYARLQHAAKEACGGSPTTTGSRIVRPQWHACLTLALEEAVATLDRPALTAYHAERTGTAARIARAGGR